MAYPTAFREPDADAASAVPAPACPLPLRATACTPTPLSPAPNLPTPSPSATPALAINLQHGLLQGDPMSPYDFLCRFLTTCFANLMHPDLHEDALQALYIASIAYHPRYMPRPGWLFEIHPPAPPYHRAPITFDIPRQIQLHRLPLLSPFPWQIPPAPPNPPPAPVRLPDENEAAP
jgi:hypothetical protein